MKTPTYACTTEGCAIGDCDNCRAVAQLALDAQRYHFLTAMILREPALVDVVNGTFTYMAAWVSKMPLTPLDLDAVIDMARLKDDGVTTDIAVRSRDFQQGFLS